MVFRSGPLEGFHFKGLYYMRGRSHDENKPVVARDAGGKVPDLSAASPEQYRYASYRGPRSR